MPDWTSIFFDPARITSHAHFSTTHGPIEIWFRQTPGQDGIFADTRFSAEPSGSKSEWLVICDEPPEGFQTRIPRNRRILFIGEPPSIKIYPARYLNQFGLVVAPNNLPGYNGCHIRQHCALQWHYGRSTPFTWSELQAEKPKTRQLSVFCSSKILNMQQNLRVRFVNELKKRFGPRIDHFGNGFNHIGEKADGLDPYCYTIVLENNLCDGFWTEKLGDAYLAGCFPIYAGGRIPDQDFDSRARLEIDLFRWDEALRAIETLIETAKFEDFREILREQRRRVMLTHNLFAVANRLIIARNDCAGLMTRAEKIMCCQDLAPAQ